MRLSDREIHDHLDSGELVVLGPRAEFPFDPARQVQPCSIDLRLDSIFFRFRDEIQAFDVKDLDKVTDYIEELQVRDGQPIRLPPGSVLFGQLYEQLRLPTTVSGKIVGRSRIARLGLAIHATGDFINPGFEGAMPLQLINHNRFPLVIYPMLTVCQLVLVQLTSTPITRYSERSDNPYHRERHASPSVLHHDPVLSAATTPDLARETERRLLDSYRQRRAASRFVRDIGDLVDEKIGQRARELMERPKIEISNSTIGVLSNESVIGRANAILAAGASNIDREALNAFRSILEFLGTENCGLQESLREEAAKIVGDLATEASKDSDKRHSSSSLRALVNRVAEIIKTSAAGSTLWLQWGPHLSTLFS